MGLRPHALRVRVELRYNLTLKNVSKLLLSNWNQRNSTKLSPLIFFFKITINEKGEINETSMMVITTMLSPFDRPWSHIGLFFRGIYSLNYCTVYISTWSYENRVNKHCVIFLNFPCLIACLLCCLLLFFVCLFCVEVDEDRKVSRGASCKALRWGKVITYYRIIFSFHLAKRISHPDPGWDRKVRYCSLF